MTFDVILKIKNINAVEKQLEKATSNIGAQLSKGLGNAIRDYAANIDTLRAEIVPALKDLTVVMGEFVHIFKDEIMEVATVTKDHFVPVISGLIATYHNLNSNTAKWVTNMRMAVKKFVFRHKEAIEGIKKKIVALGSAFVDFGKKLVALPLWPLRKLKDLATGWIDNYVKKIIGFGSVIWALDQFRDTLIGLVKTQEEMSRTSVRLADTTEGVARNNYELTKSALQVKKALPTIELEPILGFMSKLQDEGITSTKRMQAITKQLVAFGEVTGEMSSAEALLPIVASLEKVGKLDTNQLGRTLDILNVSFKGLAPSIAESILKLHQAGDLDVPLDKLASGASALNSALTNVGVSLENSQGFINSLLATDIEQVPDAFKDLKRAFEAGDFETAAERLEFFRKQLQSGEFDSSQIANFAQTLGISEEFMIQLKNSTVDLTDTMGTFQKEFEGGGRNIVKAYEQTTDQGFKIFEKWWGKVKTTFMEILNEITIPLNRAIKSVGRLFSVIVMKITGNKESVENSFTDFFGGLFNNFSMWVDELTNKISAAEDGKTIFSVILDHVMELIDKIPDIKTIGETLKSVFEFLGDIGRGIRANVEIIAGENGIISNFLQFTNQILEGLVAVGDFIKENGVLLTGGAFLAAAAAIGSGLSLMLAPLGNPLVIGGLTALAGLVGATGWTIGKILDVATGTEESKPTSLEETRIMAVEAATSLPPEIFKTPAENKEQKELLSDIREILVRMHTIEKAILEANVGIKEETRIKRLVEQSKGKYGAR